MDRAPSFHLALNLADFVEPTEVADGNVWQVERVTFTIASEGCTVGIYADIAFATELELAVNGLGYDATTTVTAPGPADVIQCYL